MSVLALLRVMTGGNVMSSHEMYLERGRRVPGRRGVEQIRGPGMFFAGAIYCP